MFPYCVVMRALCCAVLLVAVRGGGQQSPDASAAVLAPEIVPQLPQVVEPVDDDDDDATQTVRRVCRVTAYCDRGITAAGIPSGVGQCAAPEDIPLGSKVYIPALKRTLVVSDRTHRRFRKNTVDIFIPSRDDCLQFGRKYLECEFIVVEQPVPYGTLRIAMSDLRNPR